MRAIAGPGAGVPDAGGASASICSTRSAEAGDAARSVTASACSAMAAHRRQRPVVQQLPDREGQIRADRGAALQVIGEPGNHDGAGGALRQRRAPRLARALLWNGGLACWP